MIGFMDVSRRTFLGPVLFVRTTYECMVMLMFSVFQMILYKTLCGLQVVWFWLVSLCGWFVVCWWLSFASSHTATVQGKVRCKTCLLSDFFLSVMSSNGKISGSISAGIGVSLVNALWNCRLSASAFAIGSVTVVPSVFSSVIPVLSVLFCFTNCQNLFMLSYSVLPSSDEKRDSPCDLVPVNN